MLATTNVYSGYLQKLRRFIRRHEMLLGGEPVLVAVSGGVDSMVLLDMLLRLAPTMNLTLGVAHYEHGLRGEASKQDAQFVVEAARRHGLKVYVGHGDVKQIAEDHKLSVEEAARRARYTFLRKVARKHKFPVVVTAHSANDNAETVLLNLIRGSGVRGLAAIPPMRQMGEGIILGRPFLDFERSEIERYARELEIEWREDESNESSRFLRNRLRSELLPLLQQYNPSIIGTLNTTAEIMRNLEQYLSQSVQTAIERVMVEKSKERLSLNLHHIKHYLPAMQTEIVQRGVSQAFDIPPISFNATARALALLYRETGQKADLGAGLTALRDRDSLVVLREIPLPPELEHPFERGEDLEVGRVRLRSAAVPRDRVQFSKNGRVEFFDADKLPVELVVRSWREGDRFRPLGMEGEKKVSDFLVDAKTPRDRKRHVLVLASDDAIVWVCGMRIDERYKVTDETTNVLRIEMQVLPPSQPSQRPEGERAGGRGGRGRGDRDDRGRRPDQGGRRAQAGDADHAEDERGEPPQEGARADDRHSGRRGEGHRGAERPREERFGVEAPRDERSRDERPRDEKPRDASARDERPRDEKPRDEKPRDDRPRDDRQRGEKSRDARPRDERPRDDRPREERPRGEKPRDARPRDERSRDDRPRDDRPRGEKPRDDRPREERPREERPREERPRGEKPRDDRPRDERPRDDRPRDERPRDDRPRDDRKRDERPHDERPRDDRPRDSRGRDDRRRDGRRNDERPASERPASERPASERPASERPADERSAIERPADERPTVERPAGDVPAERARPGREEPRGGKPRQETPMPDEPRADEGQPAAIVPKGVTSGGKRRVEPPATAARVVKVKKAPAKPRKTAAEKRADVDRIDAERAASEAASPVKAKDAADVQPTPETGPVRSPRTPRRAPTARTSARKKSGLEGDESGDRPQPEE